MSSAVKVTREHRLHALMDVYGSHESSLSSTARSWAESGDDVLLFVGAARVAKRRAEAEHNTRASLIATVVTELRGLIDRATPPTGAARFVHVDSIELLIEHLEHPHA